jgi:uncharacterized protein (DUF2236 family)
MMPRVHRERVLLVGGQRALILQLAHPLVAAGVAQHSDFPARAMQRLRRTLDLSLATVFGSEREAEEATAAIRSVHERVTGLAGETPYRATDPRLLLWVNATLIDTTLVVYQRFVRRLSERERRAYYRETRASATMFGLPAELVPADLPAFQAYVREMLAGPELGATEEGRRLVEGVLRPPIPLRYRPPTALIRLLTLAMLPERVRRMFDLRAGPASRGLLEVASRASRLALPLVPARFRQFSAARRAA